MSDIWIHPAMVILVGALLLPFVPRTVIVFKGYLVAVPLLAFLSVIFMNVPEHEAAASIHGQFTFMKWQLTFGRVDAIDGHALGFAALAGNVVSLTVELQELIKRQLEGDASHVCGSFDLLECVPLRVVDSAFS